MIRTPGFHAEQPHPVTERRAATNYADDLLGSAPEPLIAMPGVEPTR